MEHAQDWVVIIDESVQFGQNKLLLVYGIRQANIPFGRSLLFSDLEPLVLASKSSWTGDLIARELETLEKSIGKIIYAVADHGNSIRKALRIKDIFHVYDITHCISIIVEHVYKKDPEFKEYTKKLARLRGSQALGKFSYLLPPAQRAKSRFMNLRPIADWGMSVLRLLDHGSANTSQAERDNLKWVLQYQELIRELHQLNDMVNKIQLEVKTNGLTEQSFEKCQAILVQQNKPRLKVFRSKLLEHLVTTLRDCTVTGIRNILCSSDCIESAFGKYKNYIQDNPMTGITNLSLSLASFTGKSSKEEITDAMKATRVRNVADWTSKNIGETTLSKRMKTLKWDAKKRTKTPQI